MPDSNDNGNLGRVFGAGQRTVEHTGRGELASMLAHLASLAIRRSLEVVFWPATALLIGPAVLPVFVAVAIRPTLAMVADWTGARVPQEDEKGRVRYDKRGEPLEGWRAMWSDDFHWTLDVVAFAATGALLLMSPTGKLSWWPLPWQSRASWFGLWPDWPGVLRYLVPGWLLVRVTFVAAVLRAWTEMRHADNRDRQEIEVPTLSGAAYAQTQAHLVEIDNWRNPHRDPTPPPEQKPLTSPNRAVPVYGGKPDTHRSPTLGALDVELDGPAWAIESHGHGMTLVSERLSEPPGYIETYPDDPLLPEFPVALFRGGGPQAEVWARWVLADEPKRTSYRAAYPVFVSDGNGRKLYAWLEARRLCRRLPGNQRELTAAGRWTLGEVAAGRWQPCDYEERVVV